ncbi:protein FAR1-RELATED SEQUENCE 6-like [Bidens hawaiensis]|uniref:protein FAR1-RELATED SEQUENCE 6-like n=1 Tax=Bidens hawaiensis TaxID=980011 RepID=UPI0040491E62
MQISRPSISDQWCVKTISHQHQCLQTRVVGLYIMGTIAKEIESEIETNPTIPVKSLQDKIQKKHQIHVSEVKVRRAKKLANDKKDGDFIQQYGLLRAYLEQLVKANPGSYVKIDVEPCHDPSSPTRQFRRVYICYGATKKGFQMLGREFLGLDGCFMKGPFPGQILTSVSIDGNRCIYPVAFALVEAETLHSWTWFLECLKDTLDFPTDANFTFISDRQKGLIPALEKVFPRAEHRFCVRHIHENMKKQWRGDVSKNMFLKAAVPLPSLTI